MTGIIVLRNKGVLCIGLACYVVAIWALFVTMNEQDITWAGFVNNPEMTEPQVIVALYQDLVVSEHPVTRNRLVHLSEGLARIGRYSDALEVQRRIYDDGPHNRAAHLHLALALHNAEQYEEAEAHFSMLLQE